MILVASAHYSVNTLLLPEILMITSFPCITRYVYRISSNRRPGVYFFHDCVDPVSKRGRRLFEGGVYLLDVLVHVTVHGQTSSSVRVEWSLFCHRTREVHRSMQTVYPVAIARRPRYWYAWTTCHAPRPVRDPAFI